jgi:hypothetical protein
MAMGGSMLGARGFAGSWPEVGALSGEDKRRADLEAFLKIFPPSRTPATGRINAYDKTWED